MILLYKGKSLISKLIKWQTFGIYSHAAWWCQDGTVIEAWHKKTVNGKLKLTLKEGVQRHDSPATIHTPGTEIDVFAVPGIDEAAVEAFLVSQIGKDYDFAPVIRGFTFRVMLDNPNKWFCSELTFAGVEKGGINLLRDIPAWKVSPGLLSYSPLLEPVGTIITRDNIDFDFKTLDSSYPFDSSNPSESPTEAEPSWAPLMRGSEAAIINPQSEIL